MSIDLPIPTAFTAAVATRTYEIARAGTPSTLVVEIGQPIQDVPTVSGYDWRCPVRISEGGVTRDLRACGVDSFQALQLGLQVAQQEVEQVAAEPGAAVALFGEPL
ncbi:hypothetical protein F8S13_02945 [Chloroflexia bacterium SDU3-3]|nr:hypothetical protein F8S13_02945 [Chloroflexia bacterium SDU3-3]